MSFEQGENIGRDYDLVRKSVDLDSRLVSDSVRQLFSDFPPIEYPLEKEIGQVDPEKLFISYSQQAKDSDKKYIRQYFQPVPRIRAVPTGYALPYLDVYRNNSQIDNKYRDRNITFLPYATLITSTQGENITSFDIKCESLVRGNPMNVEPNEEWKIYLPTENKGIHFELQGAPNKAGLKLEWSKDEGTLSSFAHNKYDHSKSSFVLGAETFSSVLDGMVNRNDDRVVTEWIADHPYSSEGSFVFRRFQGEGDNSYAANYDKKSGLVVIKRSREGIAKDIFTLPYQQTNHAEIIEKLIPKPLSSDVVGASTKYDLWKNSDVMNALDIKWYQSRHW